MDFKLNTCKSSKTNWKKLKLGERKRWQFDRGYSEDPDTGKYMIAGGCWGIIFVGQTKINMGLANDRWVTGPRSRSHTKIY